MIKQIVILSFLTVTTALGSHLPESGNSLVKNPDEHLIFAFELVRHGARAPVDDKKISDFTVGKG